MFEYAVLSALLIRIKFKQDKSPICLPYTTKFKVKKLSDFWKFYLFSRQYYKLTLAHFLLELSKVKITSFKSTTEIIIWENVNLVFSSVCFEKINNFSSVNPPNCPPFEFWVGRPATKHVVLSMYSPNIKDKWTMCISNTCCSKLKFVISSYLQIEISTHPNQILPIKLKVNKQLWKWFQASLLKRGDCL